MRLAAAYFEIAVAAAKRIEKFFFVTVVRKAHAIVQLIELPRLAVLTSVSSAWVVYSLKISSNTSV